MRSREFILNLGHNSYKQRALVQDRQGDFNPFGVRILNYQSLTPQN